MTSTIPDSVIMVKFSEYRDDVLVNLSTIDGRYNWSNFEFRVLRSNLQISATYLHSVPQLYAALVVPILSPN